MYVGKYMFKSKFEICGKIFACLLGKTSEFFKGRNVFLYTLSLNKREVLTPVQIVISNAIHAKFKMYPV